MVKKYSKFVIYSVLVWLPAVVYASRTEDTISNIMVPVTIFAKAIHVACYIIGFSFIMSGFVQYKQYRQNPQQIRLSTPIFLLLGGICVLFLPWLMGLSGSFKS